MNYVNISSCFVLKIPWLSIVVLLEVLQASMSDTCPKSHITHMSSTETPTNICTLANAFQDKDYEEKTVTNMQHMASCKSLQLIHARKRRKTVNNNQIGKSKRKTSKSKRKKMKKKKKRSHNKVRKRSRR